MRSAANKHKTAAAVVPMCVTNHTQGTLNEGDSSALFTNRPFSLEVINVMLWVTRQKPHVDRCASAWLIKRFIDKEAVFQFIAKESEIPKGAIGFTLPKAEINPVDGVKTTFDVLAEKYQVNDLIVRKIKDIVRDFEFNEEEPKEIQLKETLGVCYILKGLEKTSRTDDETISKAFVVMDALYATLRELEHH